MGEPLPGQVGAGFSIPDKIPEEEEIQKALGRMHQGKAPGPSAIKVDDYGMGQRCLTVLQATWEGSLLVPKKGGHYGNHIQTSRGVQQGDIISPTLFNIIVDAILRYERSAISRDQQGLGQHQFTDVRFHTDDGAIAGTDAEAVQYSLDSVIKGFARMGIKVNRRKTKWMYVCGEKRVNCIQHGAYYNLIQGGTDSYVDRGHQQIKCPMCDKHMQRRCVQRHLLHAHPEQLGQHKINFFSPTPQRASGPR